MNKMIGKLWAGIILIIMIIFVISWVFQIVFLEKYYIYQRANTMEKEAKKVAAMIENGFSSNDISTEIANFGSAFNCIVILADENFSVYNTSSTKFGKESVLVREIIQYMTPQVQQETSSRIQMVRAWAMRKANSVVIALPVKSGGKGYVFIDSMIEPIKETTALLKLQLTVIGLISLFIGSMIAFLLANKFSKPILEINKASQRIAVGDFDTVVSIESKDEVGMLARTINHMASQLKQTDDLKKEFIANISHELKTPISSIRAYGELLLDSDDLEKDEKDRYAGIIVKNTEKLIAMVEDILELSEIQSGCCILEPSCFCLNSLIQDVYNNLQALAEEKDVLMALDTFNDTIYITADRDKIQSVFSNILQNAIRHSPPQSEVQIKLTCTNAKIHVDIIDHGEGIPADKLPNIWDRFYKADRSRKSGNSGAGLGMAIVKEIFELHRYTYGIESQPGAGTRVWFEIPEEGI